MKFKYISQDKNGVIQKGIIEAPDSVLATKQIKDNNQTPISLKSFEENNIFSKISHISLTGVSLEERIMFTKNLAGMLQAGLSVSRSLTILEKQTQNYAYKNILQSLSDTISKGGDRKSTRLNSSHITISY